MKPFCTLLTFLVLSITALKAQDEPLPVPAQPKYSFNNIMFDTWQTNINSEGIAELDRLAKLLKEKPSLKASFVGHCDNVGTPEANQTLSENRAKLVFDYVAKKGIAKERLSSSGMGSSKPVVGNNTSEGRKRNRRVEITVISE